MRRHQLDDALRGVDLLLAHLKGTGNDLNAALAAQDIDAASACADPLMVVSAILIRRLRDATNGSVESALHAASTGIDDEITADELDSVCRFITGIISGRRPDAIDTKYVIVALIAQHIALGAAAGIAASEGKHVNAIVANLRVELKDQGDSVQMSDRAAVVDAAEEYAGDIEMRKSRQLAVFNVVNHWNDAANVMNDTSLRNGLAVDGRDSLSAVSLVAVTFAALAGGIYQLAERDNLYPATTLLRQLVEAEFILWKFAQGEAEMLAWYRSTEDERRAHWRPSTIYRDTNNDYRQKDYARHCEMGGHPTPLGARMAAGVPSFRPLASIFTDVLTHSRDAWQYLMESAALIDAEYATQVSVALTAIDSGFQTTLREYAAVDLYGYATAFFSDPIY